MATFAEKLPMVETRRTFGGSCTESVSILHIMQSCIRSLVVQNGAVLQSIRCPNSTSTTCSTDTKSEQHASGNDIYTGKIKFIPHSFWQAFDGIERRQQRRKAMASEHTWHVRVQKVELASSTAPCCQ